MARIHQEVSFSAAPAKVYKAIMDAKQHAEFTGAPATIDGKEGGAFSVYGGGVAGRTLELVPNKRIVQAWRGADWPEGIYSIVRLELKDSGGKTKLTLDHDAVPDDQADKLTGGWPKMYWEPLKKFLG